MSGEMSGGNYKETKKSPRLMSRKNHLPYKPRAVRLTKPGLWLARSRCGRGPASRGNDADPPRPSPEHRLKLNRVTTSPPDLIPQHSRLSGALILRNVYP